MGFIAPPPGRSALRKVAGFPPQLAGHWSDGEAGFAGAYHCGIDVAEDVGIGIEPGFPDTIAEDNDGRVLLVGTEATAESHAELGDVEEIGGGGLAPETLGIAAAGNGGGEKFVESGDAGEGLGVVANVGIERPGEIVTAFVAIGGVERKESGRIANGSGMKDETRNHGEDGGVGANAERESEDSNGGEGGFVAKEASGETEIFCEGFNGGESALVADGLFSLFQATEGEEGLTAGFFGRHAASKVVVNVELEVEREFGVEVAVVSGVFTKEIDEALESGAKIHGWTSIGSELWSEN